MSNNRRFDWAGFLVHFFFGAVIGAVMGFGLWVKSSSATSPSLTPGLYYIGGAALVLGLIAGCLGDRLWHSFADWFRGW
jgi:hypothetical protein